MAKYLILWETDNTLLPTDPTELAKVFTLLHEAITEDVKSGRLKDWGIAAAGGFGYSIVEVANEKEIYGTTLRCRPYIKTISITPVLSVAEVVTTYKVRRT